MELVYVGLTVRLGEKGYKLLSHPTGDHSDTGCSTRETFE